MTNIRTGYCLFVLECKNHIETISGRTIDTSTLEYIASNIWKQLTDNIQNKYKDIEQVMFYEGRSPSAPGVVTQIRFVDMCEEYDVFHILKDDPKYIKQMEYYDKEIEFYEKEIELYESEMAYYQNRIEFYEKEP